MEHYVGIDLHARTLELCVIDAEKGERILERARVPNRLPEILELLEPFKEGGVSIAVESTFNWYWLVDGLQDAGYEVHLAHTLGNARITKAKVKTYRRDAYRLARLLRSGDLQEGYIYLSRRSGRGRKAIVRNNVGHKFAIVVWMMLTHGVEPGLFRLLMGLDMGRYIGGSIIG